MRILVVGASGYIGGRLFGVIGVTLLAKSTQGSAPHPVR